MFSESSVKSRETRNTSFSDFSLNSNTSNVDDSSFNSERLTCVKYSFELDSEEEIDSDDDSEFVNNSSNESFSPRKYSIETNSKNIIFHPDVLKKNLFDFSKI